MDWFATEVGMSRHRKTIHLKELLGVTLSDTCGVLLLVWELIGEQFDDGDVTEMSDALLSNACNYTVKRRSKPDRTPLLDALIESKHIDMVGEGEPQQLAVHNWYKRNSRYLKDRERKEKARQKKKDMEF